MLLLFFFQLLLTISFVRSHNPTDWVMAGQGGYSTLAVSLYLKLDYSFPLLFRLHFAFACECECVASDKMLFSFFPLFFLVFIHPWWMTTYKALFALLSRLAARRLMLMEGEKSVWERKHPEPTIISSFHDEEEGKAKGACKEGSIDRQARQHIPLQTGCGTISHPLSLLYCPTFSTSLQSKTKKAKKKRPVSIIKHMPMCVWDLAQCRFAFRRSKQHWHLKDFK